MTTKTPLQKEQLRVLEDTVKYYSKDVKRRAYDPVSKTCKYSGTDIKGCTGTGCAVGRLIPLKLRRQLRNTVVKNIFYDLPPEVQRLSLPFLENLQSLHDERYFWNSGGLTQMGLNKVAHIKKEFNL